MKSSHLLRKVIAASMVLAMAAGTGVSTPIAQVIGTTISVSATETWGDYEYETLEDNTVRITHYNGNAQSVAIPSKINNIAVTEIGSHAFYDNKTLRSLTIPSGVKVIRERAFQYCENLKSVSLPNGLTTIEDGGFEFCYALKSVNIPSTVKDMGIYVFQHDKNLTSVTLSSTMTYLPDNGFNECSSLTEITIPDCVERIGSMALSNCRSLKKINFGQNTQVSYIGSYAFSGSSMESFVIPDSVTEISDNIFSNCYSLKSVTMGSGLTYLSTEMFFNCPDLTTVTIPDTVTRLDWRCFKNCTSLTEVHLSENIEELSGEVFCNCTALTDVYMGENIRTIGENAFSNCPQLANFHNIPQGGMSINHYALLGTKWYADQEDGPVYFGNVLYNYKGSMAENTSVTVPESTVYLSEQTFRTNRNLKSVTLPASLEEVDFQAVFNRSVNLEAINIAEGNPNYKSVDGIVYTKDGVYMIYCPKGKTGAVTLPEGVQYLHWYNPLRNCNKITSLTFSSTLRDFYTEDFTTMSALEAINVPSDNENFASVDGILYGKYHNYDTDSDYLGILYCCPPAKSGVCNVPDGVEELHWSAFRNASKITVLNIPASVVRYFMEPGNLQDMDSLTAINIADNSESDYCTVDGILYNKDMTEMYTVPNAKTGAIHIPDTVTYIAYAFPDCSKITEVYLPASLTDVHEDEFDTCTSLTGIYVDEDNEVYASDNGAWLWKNNDNNTRRLLCVPKALTSYTVPDDILNYDYIRYGAFDNCALQTLNLPATFDGSYWWWNVDYMIHACKNLKTIHADENSTVYRSINGVLYNKEKTELIAVPAAYEGVLELPASIRSVRYEAFQNCTSLTGVRFQKSFDNTLDFDMFNDCTSLATLSFANNTYYKVVDGGVYNNAMTELYFVSKNAVGEFAVPSTVTYINESAFVNCSQLTKISFPQGMRSMEVNFTGCTALQTVEIPDSMEELRGDIVDYDEYQNPVYRFAIEGYEGSYAEKYANSNDIPFRRLASVITLDKTEVAAAVGRTVKLIPTIKADNTFDKTVTFTSENPSIASVSQDGTVTAIAPGTVKITAACNGKTASCMVTVHSSLSTATVLSDDNILVNGSITINTTAQGGVGSYTYAFYTKPASASTYTTLKKSSVPKAVFTPTQSGAYNIKVMVTDGEKYTAYQILTVQVNDPIANVSTLSAQQSVLGDAVTINGLSENGLGGTTYQYEYKLASANTWTVLSPYSTASSVSFKPSAAGTYNIRVTAKDSGGNTAVKALSLTVAGRLANNSTLNAESATLGDTVTLNGAASGGTGGYTYAYYLRHADDAQWTTLSGFANKTSVQTTPSKAGVYQVCIKVKDQDGTVASSYLFLSVSEPLQNTSTLSSDNIVQGDTVTVNAASTGGKGDCTYAVYYKKATDTKWTRKQDYSANPSVVITPAMSADYMINVKAKDSAGTIAEKTLNVKVGKKVQNLSTVSAETIAKGDSVVIRGKASDGRGSKLYKYEYKLASAETWTVLEDYSEDTAAVLKPSAAGAYEVRVTVKDATGTTAAKTLTFTVAGELTCLSTISTQRIVLGGKITMNGAGSDGVGSYTYAYYVKHFDDTKWTTVSGFSDKTSVEYTPKKTGYYLVCIKVKDSTGTVAKEYMNLLVSNKLQNNSTVSAETIALGNTVTVNAAGSEGVGGYTYAVFYKKTTDTKWTTKQNYSANATIAVKPAKATEYQICVKVKDASGTISKKYFTIQVTNA